MSRDREGPYVCWVVSGPKAEVLHAASRFILFLSALTQESRIHWSLEAKLLTPKKPTANVGRGKEK